MYGFLCSSHDCSLALALVLYECISIAFYINSSDNVHQGVPKISSIYRISAMYFIVCYCVYRVVHYTNSPRVCVSSGGPRVVPRSHGNRRVVGHPDPHQMPKPDRPPDVPTALHTRGPETQVRTTGRCAPAPESIIAAVGGPRGTAFVCFRVSPWLTDKNGHDIKNNKCGLLYVMKHCLDHHAPTLS